MLSPLHRIVRRSREFRPSDLGRVIERLHTHALKPRMSPEDFRDCIEALGFETAQAFGDRIGLARGTVESWARFGLSQDAAQLLLALVTYRSRLTAAMKEFERDTQIPLESFFEAHQLP